MDIVHAKQREIRLKNDLTQKYEELKKNNPMIFFCRGIYYITWIGVAKAKYSISQIEELLIKRMSQLQ